jgi:transposase
LGGHGGRLRWHLLQRSFQQDSARSSSARPGRGSTDGHHGSGRELKPEDQVDQIVDHYPEACRGCGREFSDDERRPGSRFGRHQVAALPPISVRLVEHRTHRLGCRECGAKTTGGLVGRRSGPELAGGAGDADG